MQPFTHLTIIVAMDRAGGIGRDNRLLCHIPEDLAYFKEKTWGGILVMGRRTYESIGRPLPGRRTVVMSRDRGLSIPDVEVVHSVEEVAALPQERLFIAGGAEIYRLFYPYATDFLLTQIDATLDADTYFPYPMPNDAWQLQEENPWATSVKGLRYRFAHYVLA